MSVRVQTEDFDLSTEIANLRKQAPKVGAVVTFLGTVRDLNEGAQVAEMELEHYPGMTEKSLEDPQFPLLQISNTMLISSKKNMCFEA